MLEPTTPGQMPAQGTGGFGRLVEHGVILAGWHCRWCSLALTKTPNGAIICIRCDQAVVTTTG